MTKILAIFAHPDDESAVAGTLALFAQNGSEVMLVCATRGEAGEISDPALATQENLGQVRQQELDNACRMLGIQHLEFLDFRDSGMKDTPENNDPRALIQAEDEVVLHKLLTIIRGYQPDIVITFEPYGWYGHPDHVAVGRLVTEAMSLTANPGAHPDIQPPFQPSRFYYAVLPFGKFREMIEVGIANGIINPNDFEANAIENRPDNEAEDQVTHVIDVSQVFELKEEAMMVHRTQFADDHPFRKIPRDYFFRAMGSEYFIQIYPDPDEGLVENPSSDLTA